jgi:hypothetical protein
MTLLPDLSTRKKLFWQHWKSGTWIAFQCWAVWYAAKVTFMLVYAGVGGAAFTHQAADVITVAALVPAFAWYIWRHMRGRADQLANGVERSDGAMTIRWGQGLLRLWVVLAVLWVGAAGLIVWQDYISGRGLTDEEIGLPPLYKSYADCDETKPWTQYRKECLPEAPWLKDKVKHDTLSDAPRFEGQDFDTLVAQHRMPDAPNLGEHDRYAKFASPGIAPKPSPALFGWVFGPPILVLLLGFAGNWIFRGFKM